MGHPESAAKLPGGAGFWGSKRAAHLQHRLREPIWARSLGCWVLGARPPALAVGMSAPCAHRPRGVPGAGPLGATGTLSLMRLQGASLSEGPGRLQPPTAHAEPRATQRESLEGRARWREEPQDDLATTRNLEVLFPGRSLNCINFL